MTDEASSGTPAPGSNSATTDGDAAPRGDRDIVTLFTKALRALGKAGRPDEAMTLAGQAWWGLKDSDPRAAERVNGTMHYLARVMAGDEKP
ncbi:hypothetical protein [Microbacterium terrisoli]|jgi:hypothetical protein|uniref:hypothetical protein n=1 Tax=Microbacterium terrisoli TaxID=3242192 RepID=UPI0028054BFD|nr:hypothetical protein [Microbacterium protaetiae]